MRKNILSNTRKIQIFFFLCLLNLSVSAQESNMFDDIIPKISISGSVDTYFRTNFDAINAFEYGADSSIIADPQAPATSFANDPGFALGMANIILEYKGNKTGFVADLVMGPRGTDAVFLSQGSSNILNQLYVYYNVSNSLRLTLGNFNTFLGYEVISPVANFHYSTSYMFSYGPFSHTGLKADFTIDQNWSAMLAVLNPTDYTEFNPFDLYSFGGQIGYSNPNGNAFLNLIYGEQAPDSAATFQIDLTTGWDLSDSFYLGFNSTYNTTDDIGFYGAALYPQIRTSENFAIGLRTEYFKELDNATNQNLVYGPDVSAFSFTLTGSYVIEDLIIKPELRLDTIDKEVFVGRNLELQENMSSFILAAIYAF